MKPADPSAATAAIAATASGAASAPPAAGAREPRLSARLGLGWAAGTLGLAILFNTVNLLLLRYLTDYLGIAAALAGLLLAASKIYDAIVNPLLGFASDRTRSRWGRRRPYLLYGGLLCALVLPALFWAPTLVGPALVLPVVALAILFYATAYTTFNVPYLALAAEMKLGYHQRSSLMSYRVSAIGFGQLLAGAAAPTLVVAFGGGTAGHAAMSATLAVVVLAGCWIAFAQTGRADYVATAAPAARARLGWRAQLRLAIDDRPFGVLLATKLLQLTGIALTQASLAYYATHVLRAREGTLALLFTALTLAMILAMPLWVAASKRLGKVRTYQLATVPYVLAALGWFVADASTPLVALLAIATVAGLGSGGMLLVGQSLLPDTIAWDRYRTGLNREGLYTGLYSTVEKIAFALGLALAGAVLGAAGYVASTGGAAVAQPEGALRGIVLCVAVLPAIAAVASAVLLQAYDLDAAKVAEAGAHER